METPLIELKEIKRYYESGTTVVKALDDTSLSIYPGEFVAIMGHSGSGKSTMMNLMGCLDRATSGVYKIFGNDVSKLNSDELAKLRRETFGFIFQRYNLLATSTAAENVEVPALYAGLSKAKRKERAESLLRDLGLGERYGHFPSQLSGGQQQRVAVARALMNNPPVILADEPTGALDSKSGQEVMNLLKKLNEEGRTIIIITHEEDVALQARRMIKLHDGKITEDSGRDINSSQKPVIPETLKSEGGNWGANTVEAVKTAFRSLRVNIFRTSLTLLGIIIGVAAVITMLAVGNGSKQKVLEQISSLGTNLIDVRPGSQGVRGSGNVATLIPADAEEMINIEGIDAVLPERNGQNSIRYGNVDYRASIKGTGENFLDVRNWEMDKGSFFTKEDVKSYATVAILGSTVVDNIFSDVPNPLGKFILIGNIPFEVIGVTKSKGAAPWGGDQDDVVFIPYTTGIARLFGYDYINNVTVKVSETADINSIQKKIEDLLLQRHGIEDFHVRNMASFIEMATTTQNTLTILLGAVAAISLLVGGIGVMNIMLVSVVERTREIGIRIATGARMSDIMVQFNTEAAVVCTIGGILGVILGLFTGYIISLFGISIYFSATPAILAFTCAVVTGIVFGFLPARKAAKLDPVVALSSE